MPYQVDQARRHKIPKTKYKVKNWREYDQAWQERGRLTVWVTLEALAAWEKDGIFTILNPPDLGPAEGINNIGQIVGLGGFLDTNGVFTAIPGARGINDAGQIVGVHTEADRNHSFLYSGGVFSNIDPPKPDHNTLGQSCGLPA
jgi:probable HAF family extracellular repeat protein